MSDSPMSRPILVSAVPPEGVTVDIVADEAERAAIAALNELPSVEKLNAKLEVRHHGRAGLIVTGTLVGAATRTCVVSLEPFVEEVREDVEMRFSPDAAGHHGDDPPDLLVGGSVDLGAVAVEFFTLGLSPYPKKPGVEFASGEERSEEESPFAALRALSGKDGTPQ